MNSGIELHDSTILSILPMGSDVIVRFAPAYIHVSEGKPGIDSGSGWVQNVDLVIMNNAVASRFDELPQELDNGDITLGEVIHRNWVPLPLDFQGEVCFTAYGMRGETLVIRGTGARLILSGERVYVEEFRGTSKT